MQTSGGKKEEKGNQIYSIEGKKQKRSKEKAL